MAPFQLLFLRLQTAPHHKPDASHLAKQAQFALLFGCSAVGGYKIHHLIFRLLKKTGRNVIYSPASGLKGRQQRAFVIIGAFS